MDDFFEDASDNQFDTTTSGIYTATQNKLNIPNKPVDCNHEKKSYWKKNKLMKQMNANFKAVILKHVTTNSCKGGFSITGNTKCKLSHQEKY